MNIPPLVVLGSQEAILSPESKEPSSEGPVIGLGDDECELVMIDNGASMLKIWSSACGGP